MSEFGPAFFIKRKDGNEISKEEQEELLKVATKIAQELKIEDNDGNLATPEFYDYDNYEDKSVSFVMFYDSFWREMPEEIQRDTEEVDSRNILKVGGKIDELFPDTYEYQSYYVEV